MQVAKTLMKSLDAKGVAVTIDAAHQCMTMRGVKKENLPTKKCIICGLEFSWRKKWQKNWDEVKYCSKLCRSKR